MAERVLDLQRTAGNTAVTALLAPPITVQRQWARSYGHPTGALPPAGITPANVVDRARGKGPYYVSGATQKDPAIANDPVKGWIYTFYAYYSTVFSKGNERWRIVLAAHTHIKQDHSKVAGNMFIPGHDNWYDRTDASLVGQVPAYDPTNYPDGWTRGTFGSKTYRYPNYYTV